MSKEAESTTPKDEVATASLGEASSKEQEVVTSRIEIADVLEENLKILRFERLNGISRTPRA